MLCNRQSLYRALPATNFHLVLVGEYKIKEIGRGIRTALDLKNETILFWPGQARWPCARKGSSQHSATSPWP
jgi:hypothetical protein